MFALTLVILIINALGTLRLWLRIRSVGHRYRDIESSSMQILALILLALTCFLALNEIIKIPLIITASMLVMSSVAIWLHIINVETVCKLLDVNRKKNNIQDLVVVRPALNTLIKNIEQAAEIAHPYRDQLKSIVDKLNEAEKDLDTIINREADEY